MILWLLEKFGFGRRVVLLHFDGEITVSLATRVTKWGMSCYVYPLTRFSPCLLKPDGSVQHSYIKQWDYYKGA